MDSVAKRSYLGKVAFYLGNLNCPVDSLYAQGTLILCTYIS